MLIVGVVNEVPVASELPPVGAANQLIVPAVVLPLNVTVPASQRLADVPVTVGVLLMVTTTALRGEIQPLACVAST